MRKEISQTIEIPEGVEANLEESTLKIKGPEGETQREFNFANIEFELKDKKINIKTKSGTKREKKKINTMSAHIQNMIKGVQEKFEYLMKICFSHFPMTVDLQGDSATIKNFLGEKISRKVKIPKGAEVEVKGDIVSIKAIDKEVAGQTAANFETATKIRGRDRRIFQDGIFITHKGGKEI